MTDENFPSIFLVTMECEPIGMVDMNNAVKGSDEFHLYWLTTGPALNESVQNLNIHDILPRY